MIRNTLASIWLGCLFFCSSPAAQAAQNGQVIVPKANVYQYPQASSRVISTLPKGSTVAVSNLPTENFYKVRLPNGDLGWLSGNDILTGAAASNSIAVPSAGQRVANPSDNQRARKRSPPRKLRQTDEADAYEDSTRILLGYGLQFLSYGGLKDSFGGQGTLNPGHHFSLEGQFKINPKLFWAVRFAVMNATSGAQQTDSITSQTITVKEIPVEVGVMWSPVNRHSFRWGVGAYLGVVLGGNVDVTQATTNTALVKEATYSTTEICADLTTQISVGLGDAFGIFVEADYHYDKTGTVPPADKVSVGSFAIDYSGIAVRAGIELRL